MILSPRILKACAWTLIASAAVLARPVVARAGLILDQQHVVDPVLVGGAVNLGVSSAQTFTVGVTSTLERVELQVGRGESPTAPLIVAFRRTLVSGAPDPSAGGLLATLVADASLFPLESFTTTFTALDLGSQAFPVTAGERLTISLSSATAGTELASYRWAVGDTPAPYPGGQAFLRLPPTAPSYIPFPSSSSDYGFRTYVAGPAGFIPEPASFLLACLGSVALLGAARRWRHLGRPGRPPGC